MIAAGLAIALAWLSPPQDPAVKAALKRFQEDFARAGSDVDQKNAAVAALAATPHEAALQALVPLLTREKPKVRIKIAQELAHFSGVAGTGPALLQALRHGSNAGKNQEAVRIVLLRGLGRLKCVEALADVNRLIEDREVWVANAAIGACAELGQRSSIPPLMRALRRVEGPAGEGIPNLNPLKELEELIPLEAETESRERDTVREVLREPLLRALHALTGRSFTHAREYEAWWKDGGRKE